MRHGRRTGKSAAELIARVILSYHCIHNWTSDDQKDYLAQRCGKDEHYAEIKRAFEELFNRADIALKLQKAAAELSAVQLRIGTISSQRLAVEYCRRYRSSRIFYVAPFMSIL